MAAEETSSESLLREMAELIEYHDRMASRARRLDDLAGFLLPPKFEAWLIRYRTHREESASAMVF
jgi:hypothetical protein